MPRRALGLALPRLGRADRALPSRRRAAAL